VPKNIPSLKPKELIRLLELDLIKNFHLDIFHAPFFIAPLFQKLGTDFLMC